MSSLTRTLASFHISTCSRLSRFVTIDHSPASANVPSSPSDSQIAGSSSPTTASSSSKSTNPADANPLILPYHHPIPRSPSFPSKFPNPPTHKHINFPDPLYSPPARNALPEVLGGNMATRRETVLSAITGLSSAELRGLTRTTSAVKRVVNMSKKGKLRSYLCYVVVGSPHRGLVGMGRGRGVVMQKAVDQAFHRAVLSMDYVNRYETRTLWGQGNELSRKFGATLVKMRARPPGFGLMVPASIHPVLTACGIRDASASIEGSREGVSVMKAVLQMLHGGANPPYFGSGTGTKGRREDKGTGMRSKDEIERERGRYGVDIGQRV